MTLQISLFSKKRGVIPWLIFSQVLRDWDIELRIDVLNGYPIVKTGRKFIKKGNSWLEFTIHLFLEIYYV